MISNSYTVTTTRSQVIAAAPANRTVYLHVIGNGIVYLGNSSVTAANGMLTEKAAVPFQMFLPAGETLYAITASGTEDLRVLRASNDGN
jgi:hypothetical protein